MPCLLALIAVFFPRVVIVLLFLFTNYLGRAYETALWPILGFIFMPFTTLAYAWAINATGELGGLSLVVFILAVLMDLGAWGGGGESARRRR